MKKISIALCLLMISAGSSFAQKLTVINDLMSCSANVTINAHFNGHSCNATFNSTLITMSAMSNSIYNNVTDINGSSCSASGPGWSGGVCANLFSAWDWDWVAVDVSGIGFNVANPAWCNFCTGCNTKSITTPCGNVTVDWTTSLGGDYTVRIH